MFKIVKTGSVMMMVSVIGLLLAGCVVISESPPASSPSEGESTPAPGTTGTLGSSPENTQFESQGIWMGTWESEQWGTMQLVQDGNRVTGEYEWDEGKIDGMINGNMLTGTWSEKPSYQPPDDAGDFKFSLSKDGTSFTGEWRYGSTGDWQGSWNGKKVSRALIGK